MPKKFSTSPGQVYSRLTVVSWMGEYSHVRCECGVSKMVRNDKLKDGTTKSCGCLAKEIAATAKKLLLRPPAREKATVNGGCALGNPVQRGVPHV
jgi:hypothetical protein